MRLLSLLFVFFFVEVLPFSATAQNALPGQWLLRLTAPGAQAVLAEKVDARYRDGSVILQDNGVKSNCNASQAAQWTAVMPSLNIWLLSADSADTTLKEWLRRQPEVLEIQANHILHQRCNVLPGDPLFPQQWHLLNPVNPEADLDAENAWSITTGGLSAAGDTIVVAVVDAGVQKWHPDLKNNLWKNYAEIPGDGIDNDANGYVDDYAGWNILAQNDQIQGLNSMHGTPVCGIIGASGDNGTGVTGVNWNVKILFIAGSNVESEVLSAYEYIYQTRHTYNETQGEKGAFVVASNCSWGIDYGKPDDAPLWCAAFDKLGEAGVLSVAATANVAIDVDFAGDLPTTCPSEYLIAVTSLDETDKKAPDAAWGLQNIDLGAYGENIFSTSTGSQYGAHSGTSFAAPQVSGAIALLYATSCPELVAQSKYAPASAALWAKKLLQDNVAPVASLTGKTVTGGKLQLQRLLSAYQHQCSPCPTPFALKAVNITPFFAILKWLQIPDVHVVSLRWRKAGSPFWNTIDSLSETEYYLEGLQPCTKYEFSLRSICSGAETGEWSVPASFFTSGCCTAPAFSCKVLEIAGGSLVTWNNLAGFSSFRVSYHPFLQPDWQTVETQDTSVLLENLQPCTEYELTVQGWCIGSWLTLGSPVSFTTQGCGACTEIPYCEAAGLDAQEEWIAAVQIGNWSYASGLGGGGYQDFTSHNTPKLQLSPQTVLDLSLTPGFWGAPYKEYFCLYIDYNLDGDFEDADELVFDPGFVQEGVVSGQFTTPQSIPKTGFTRMRVMMKYAEISTGPPGSCEKFDFGQVEDYCVELLESPTRAVAGADSVFHLKIFPVPATDWVWLNIPEKEADIQIWDISGREILRGRFNPLRGKTLLLDVSGWNSGVYFAVARVSGKVMRGKILKIDH